MNIQFINLRNEKNMKRRSLKISFLTFILIFMSLGVVTSRSATNSINMTLEPEWETAVGGPNDDSVTDMIPTIDGGFTVLGEIEGSGSILVKFTATGQQEWNTSFWEMWFSGDNAFVQTTDGGYVIADRDKWRDGDNWEMFLHKRDSSGQHVWNSTFGGEVNDWSKSIALTDDEGFVIVGATNYNSSSDTWRDWDVWLVKTNSLGVPEWNSTFDGPFLDDSDTGLSVILTIDGGYAVLADTGSQSTDEWYTWMIKTDASGVEEWNHTFEGTLDSMIQIADGSFVIVGGTQDDFWLLKTDVNGQAIWNTTYGTQREEEIGQLIQTTDGGFLLAGTVDNVASGSDIWLVKTNMNGQQEWNATLIRPHEDYISSVVQVSNSSFVIAGATQPEGAENQDMWLVKVQVTEGTTTTTTTEDGDSTPGFEWGMLIGSLGVIWVFSRKRRS